MNSFEGEHNPVAVLTDAEVREIKDLYLTGAHSYVEIARRFHVARSTVQQIINGERWHHLLEPGEAEALAEMREYRNHNYPR
jgi:DNA invertase Pin-like site-specific DNA recombinase